MNIKQIVNNIYPEDKAMTMVKYEVTMSYIDKILQEKREVNSPKSKLIVAELERLAKINIAAKAEKMGLPTISTKQGFVKLQTEI